MSYPAQREKKVLYYLSGLTCTDDNFIQKAGAQRVAALRGIALVAPDTSPRGAGVAGEVRHFFLIRCFFEGTGVVLIVTSTAVSYSSSDRKNVQQETPLYSGFIARTVGSVSYLRKMRQHFLAGFVCSS